MLSSKNEGSFPNSAKVSAALISSNKSSWIWGMFAYREAYQSDHALRKQGSIYRGSSSLEDLDTGSVVSVMQHATEVIILGFFNRLRSE